MSAPGIARGTAAPWIERAESPMLCQGVCNTRLFQRSWHSRPFVFIRGLEIDRDTLRAKGPALCQPRASPGEMPSPWIERAESQMLCQGVCNTRLFQRSWHSRPVVFIRGLEFDRDTLRAKGPALCQPRASPGGMPHLRSSGPKVQP